MAVKHTKVATTADDGTSEVGTNEWNDNHTIDNNTITNDHLAGSIANGKLATDPLARANHTGTQAASTVSDFDTEVANNSAVTANTAKISYSTAASTTFTTTNRASGLSKTIRIITDGTTRSLAFPSDWKFVGTKPTEQAASKTGILTVTNFGTTDAYIVAAYAVEA